MRRRYIGCGTSADRAMKVYPPTLVPDTCTRRHAKTSIVAQLNDHTCACISIIYIRMYIHSCMHEYMQHERTGKECKDTLYFCLAGAFGSSEAGRGQNHCILALGLEQNISVESLNRRISSYHNCCVHPLRPSLRRLEG